MEISKYLIFKVYKNVAKIGKFKYISSFIYAQIYFSWNILDKILTLVINMF
jgi:hypothetical protein